MKLGVPTNSIESVVALIDGQQNQPTTETDAGKNGANGNTRTVRLRKFVDVEVPEIPEGYIRFIEASQKYNILSGTLSGWVKRNLIGFIRISRKHLYVNEEDVKARVQLNDAK